MCSPIDARVRQRRTRGKRRCSAREQPPAAVEDDGSPPELVLPPDSGRYRRPSSGILILVLGAEVATEALAVEEEDISSC